MIQNLWMVMTDLAPWLILGAAIAGLLHGLLPSDFIIRHLRGRGGVLKAVALGVPMPLCSCGVIPAGLGLKKDGASDGASVGFLISTPQTGVDSILVSASFLGWPFALFKVLAALVTGLLGGWLTELGSNESSSTEGRPVEASNDELKGIRGMVEHGLDTVRSIWGWLVIGIFVSAAISTWLPPELLRDFSGTGLVLGVGLMLMISMPLYVCATASVPIAAALVMQGLPAGTAMVFLMAGPATNLATMGAVLQGFGKKVLAIYLVVIIAGSVIAAFVFDAVIGAGPMGHGSHEHEGGLIAVVSAILITGALLWFAFEDVRYWWQRRAAPAAGEKVLELQVEGMTCMGCVRKLTGRLEAMDGVEAAVVELEPGSARVAGEIELEDLKAAVIASGFRVS